MINEKYNAANIIKILFLVIIFILFTKGFNMLGWDFIVPLKYYAFANVCIVLYYLLIRHSIYKDMFFAKYAKFVIIWGVIVIFYTNFCGGTSYYELRKCYPLVGIFFFIFCKYNFSESVILRGITIIALITAFIQIYEQIHPEFAIFGVVDPNADNYYGEIAGKRNDLYRLWVGCQSTQLLCFSYYFNDFFCRKKITSLIFTILFAISIYLYLTRQLLIVSILCILISMLLERSKSIKIYMIFGGGVILATIVNYWDLLFNSLVDDYKQDTYTTDIRWDCMAYMFDYYLSDPISAIIGHGHNPIEQFLANKFSYYMGDIGIVGDGIFYYGIIWCWYYLYIVFLFFTQLKNAIPSYLVAYVFSTFIGSLFGFPFYDRASMLVWISILYISSIYVKYNLKLGD